MPKYGPIQKEELLPNTIRAIIDIPILGGAAQSVAADAVGTPEFDHTTFKVPSEALRHAKSMLVIIDYSWAATADGTLQVFSRTNTVVRGESTTKLGGESSEWEEITVTGIVADEELCIRGNITTAGAAGETSTIYRVILRIKTGVS